MMDPLLLQSKNNKTAGTFFVFFTLCCLKSLGWQKTEVVKQTRKKNEADEGEDSISVFCGIILGRHD